MAEPQLNEDAEQSPRGLDDSAPARSGSDRHDQFVREHDHPTGISTGESPSGVELTGLGPGEGKRAPGDRPRHQAAAVRAAPLDAHRNAARATGSKSPTVMIDRPVLDGSQTRARDPFPETTSDDPETIKDCRPGAGSTPEH